MAELRLPTWTFLAKVTARFAKDETQVPRKAYVFPALRLDGQGRILDQLAYRLEDDDALSWVSPAPLGAQLKAIAENKLRTLGFHIVSFSDLMASKSDHEVLVFNLYYTEAYPSKDNPRADPASSWTTFVRVTAATFSQDLNPNAKRDLMNQELVSLFNGKDKANDVIKRSSTHVLDYIGVNNDWNASINLLE